MTTHDEPVHDPERRFEFGRNWKHFIEHNLGPEQIEVSKRHLLSFLDLPNLEKRTFLDIGCGSGLHSLAAFAAGASQIVSFDYDSKSVEATQFCQHHAGRPACWTVRQGSILDPQFVNALPQADIVYSWGVLHHTGHVWKAIEHAATRVPASGLFYIALYSADVQVDPPPEFWLDVKRRYIAASPLLRRRMELWYVWRFGMNRQVAALPVVIKRAIEYRKNRGMSYMTDIRDWLGGWPMEFVKDADAVQFCERLGLSLVKIKTGEANTEFLFRRVASSARDLRRCSLLAKTPTSPNAR